MTASVDALTDEVAGVIDQWLFRSGINGVSVAAMAVLEVQALRDGLKAARVLSGLRAAHQWTTRPGESTWRSCSCGTAGCRLPELLEESA